ncbi:neutrophil collagenase-like isoform X2 [Chironomus tepperi]|uniref:neutrophil collagenase-like isoform X2 n=1 Tax=Chironomus tepperi TaxID=113505 RepID=UPI00391F1B96
MKVLGAILLFALTVEIGAVPFKQNHEDKNIIKNTDFIENLHCGVHKNHKRFKRYSLFSKKWLKKDLTYRLNHESLKYFDQQSRKYSQNNKKAFKTWEFKTSFKFTEVKEDPVDISISFVNRNHPELDPYTFGNRTTGHSFAPGSGIGGDIHLDSKIMWCFDPNSNCIENVSFFAVIQHQIGHSLGLGHSNDSNSVMYDRYSKPKSQLSNDDYRGLDEIDGNHDKSKENAVYNKGEGTGDFIDDSSNTVNGGLCLMVIIVSLASVCVLSSTLISTD